MADVQDTKNALWRRDEQLNRWSISETNKESSQPKEYQLVKVKFEDSYVFLAACSSGDKEEVKSLIAKGADINTANIDGLTALHQACIDDKLDMVRFLVEHKADINAADNEGWTALHATASCGYLEVARYLIDQGADIAAVNNDGELAIDLAEGSDMEDLLQDEMDKQGVDAEAARDEEENMMLRDANQWLSTGYNEEPHPKTGARALHCAAAKGYIKVMELLLQAGADPDAQDFDGWTPLHAAAHWGLEDACKTLVENLCNMEIINKAGQTAMDIVDPDIEDVLRELQKQQVSLRKDKEDRIKDLSNRSGNTQYRRSSVTRMSVDQKQNVVRTNAEEEREMMMSKVVVEEDHDRKSSESSEAEEMDTESSGSEESSDDSETEKKNEINRQSLLNNTKQVNGAPTSTVMEKSKEPTPKIEERKTILPPPKQLSGAHTPSTTGSTTGTTATTTPRIQDLVKTDRLSTTSRDADKENERLSERNSNKNTTSTALMERPQTDTGLKKQALKKEDEKKDTEQDQQITNKAPLQRVASAPSKISYTGARQVPGFVPKPPVSRQESTTTSDAIDPSSWRACLRKTGSSSAVPDTTTSRSASVDRLPRSASSSWLNTHDRHTDNSKGRPISALSGDSLDIKSRYDSLSTRSLTSVGPGRTSTGLTGTASSHPVTMSTATTSAATTARGVTTTAATAATTNPSSLSSSYTYQPFTPLSRKRQTDADGTDLTKDRLSVTSVTTSTSPGVTTPTSGTTTTGTQRRSFALPARDEEKEVERKQRARRARETRRSTQGVTKEDLKLAEQELKAANNDSSKDRDRLMSTESTPRDRLCSDERSDKENKPSEDLTVSLATTTSSSLLRRREDRTHGDDVVPYNRRSYRDSTLSLDAGFNRASQRAGLTSSSSTTSSITSSAAQSTAPSSVTAPSSTSSSSTSTTVSSTTSSLTPYRQYRNKYRSDESDSTSESSRADSSRLDSRESEEKESPSQKSAAIRTRRKRESRRATGKVNPEDVQAAKTDEMETKEKPKEETSRYNRYSDLSSSLYDTSSSRYSRDRDRPSSYHSGYGRSQSSTSLSDKDKEIDYKRLYEEQREENDKLRKDMKKLQQELSDTKVDLEKLRLRSEPSRGSETAAERKEKRTLERKISELEEELRLMENMKQDNQRLKEENGALIRVISKLSK